MTLDFTRAPLPPFQHQREDAEWLTNHRYALVASEMRTGKSATVIHAAQFLFEQGKINCVVIVTPAPVRDVWADERLGEINKHAWPGLHLTVTEYHMRTRTWVRYGEGPSLDFFITNFEFLRSKQRLTALAKVCGPKTLLVGDESSFLKNWTAQQTRAFYALRKRCGWCWLLNGTPIFHSPLDLFSHGNILSPTLLDCKYITLFKARYAVQEPILGFGGKPLTTIVGKGKYTKEIIIKEICGWTNLDDLERRFKPYTVRRLQKDCLDLPPKLDPVMLTATLKESWPHYKAMRDEMVVWLSSSKVVTSATAAIKTLRLSQITGGFLSGVEDSGIKPIESEWFDSLLLGGGHGSDVGHSERDQTTERNPAEDLFGTEGQRNENPLGTEEDPLGVEGHQRADTLGFSVEVGREKLDVLLWLLEQRLEADPNLHVVAWTRFRAELFRMVREVKQAFPQFITGMIHGDQKKSERLAALALLKPETTPSGPVFVGGIEGTGSFGLDMTASHTCVTMSSGYSPGRVAQTLDRVYGPGQTEPIAYYVIVASGPKGQRTIDHDILAARLTGEDIAQRTAAAWVKALEG